MSLPRVTTAYPTSMITALQRAQMLGEIIIPTENPGAMRLQFQGLRGALRKENQSELADSVMFCIQKSPPALILRLRDSSPLAKEIEAALKSTVAVQSSAVEETEAALARILGETRGNAKSV